ncbi:MAG: hydroxymethylglutaryl-CoA lyase [Planctomycetota bacterium]
MVDRARITDVAPRDGLQNEPGLIATADKVRLVEMLATAGVDEVEATSFVSPKWVPQLADAADVLRDVSDFAEGVRYVAGGVPRGAGQTGARVDGAPLPVFSVLVPNERGFEQALEVHEAGLPLKIALFTAASETFSQKNTNASIAETIERFRPIVPRAFEADMPIRLYISCAIACPFEGAITPLQVRGVADALLELAPDDDHRQLLELDLGDTIGVAHPADILALCAAFDDLTPWLTLHLHDTHGRAAACVHAAIESGVRSFDGSAAGLGGCPYASTPERRAPGNIATETLVRACIDAGLTTGVDLELLSEASDFAADVVKQARSEHTS